MENVHSILSWCFYQKRNLVCNKIAVYVKITQTNYQENYNANINATKLIIKDRIYVCRPMDNTITAGFWFSLTCRFHVAKKKWKGLKISIFTHSATPTQVICLQAAQAGIIPNPILVSLPEKLCFLLFTDCHPSIIWAVCRRFSRLLTVRSH